MNLDDRSPFLSGGRLSAMMFLEFFVWGGWYVTAGNYMGTAGMTAVDIGWAYSAGPIAAIISPFFLGMVADRFFATEKILGTLHVLGGAALFLAPLAAERGGAVPFLAVLTVHMLLYMPTLGLTNSLAMAHMTNQEKQFPLIRVFGTIGWIAANYVVSKLLHADTLGLQFRIAGGAGVLMGLYSFTLPHTPPAGRGKRITVRDILCLDALAMLKEGSFLVFIVASMLICVPLAAYYAFAPIFVKDAGFADPAFNMSFGQMSEIFFMVIMPLFFVRLGVKWMLVAGMGAWVARYALFGFGAPAGVTWMIFAGILLHGICYDFFFVTGQIYVDKKATPDIRAQAQGFLVLVTQGIGMLAGAQIMAHLKGSIVTTGGAAALGEWKTFWLIPAAAAGVILILFIAFFHNRNGDRRIGDRVANREFPS